MMRIKIEAKIIEKSKPNKRNYTHETYSMLINNMSQENAVKFHQNKQDYRYITFTNIFINKDRAHFYVSGKDNLILDLLKHITFVQIVRIDDMVIKIEKVEELPDLPVRDSYKFKTSVVTYKSTGVGTAFNDNIPCAQNQIANNTKRKAEKLGIKGEIRSVKLVNTKIAVSKYKSGNIFSHKGQVHIDCDYAIAEMIYNVGLGEKTTTGHGFLWEV